MRRRIEKGGGGDQYTVEGKREQSGVGVGNKKRSGGCNAGKAPACTTRSGARILGSKVRQGRFERRWKKQLAGEVPRGRGKYGEERSSVHHEGLV